MEVPRDQIDLLALHNTARVLFIQHRDSLQPDALQNWVLAQDAFRERFENQHHLSANYRAPLSKCISGEYDPSGIFAFHVNPLTVCVPFYRYVDPATKQKATEFDPEGRMFVFDLNYVGVSIFDIDKSETGIGYLGAMIYGFAERTTSSAVHVVQVPYEGAHFRPRSYRGN